MPPKPLRKMTADERRAYNREKQQERRREIAQDPDALALERARLNRHSMSLYWRRKSDPEQYAAHLERRNARRRALRVERSRAALSSAAE